MPNLYKVTDMAMNCFYVRADDEEEAQMKYEIWRDTPGNIENPSARAVIGAVLIGSSTPGELPLPWANYID